MPQLIWRRGTTQDRMNAALQPGELFFDDTEQQAYIGDGVTPGGIKPEGDYISAATLAAAGGSALVGYVQAGAGAVARTAQAKARDSISVKDFGAAGDGVTDDTAAIQAAINYALTVAATIYVPTGYYKITGTLNIGLPEFTNFGFITSRTDVISGATYTANQIPGNITSNNTLPAINIVFDNGAYLVAFWTPATLAPVLSYNMSRQAPRGSLIHPRIISQAMMSGGVYVSNNVAIPQVNNLIGIYAGASCAVIEDAVVAGCGYGIVTANAYWQKIQAAYFAWAGYDCLNVATGNACDINDIVMWNSGRGIVFDGDVASVKSFHCEEVAQELTVFAADASEFGPAYLEDVSATSGAGTFAVTLGTTANTLKITACMFNGVRVSSARPSKQAWRIYGANGLSLNGCREYSYGVVLDTSSGGTINGGDFTFTSNPAFFTLLNNGIQFARFLPPGSSYNGYGPYSFLISGIAPGSIAAGGAYSYTFTLPASMNGCIAAVGHITYTSGGSNQLSVTTRILFATPNTMVITWANQSASAIDPGTMDFALLVTAMFS